MSHNLPVSVSLVRRRWMLLGASVGLVVGVAAWSTWSRSSDKLWRAFAEHAIAYKCPSVDPADLKYLDTNPGGPSLLADTERSYEAAELYAYGTRRFMVTTFRSAYSDAIEGWSVRCDVRPAGPNTSDPFVVVSSGQGGEVLDTELERKHVDGDLPDSFDWQPPPEK